MPADIFARRRKSFVLWLPAVTQPAPHLVVGTFLFGNPPAIENVKRLPLTETKPGLWEIEARRCGLDEGKVYHYWFEVTDSAAGGRGGRLWCTDPFAHTVDWRLLAPEQDGLADEDRDPAGVVLYAGGELRVTDPGGETPDLETEPEPSQLGLVPNNALVIYELPTRWARTCGKRIVGAGTFDDVRALVSRGSRAANFAGMRVLDEHNAHLRNLGANALELLPIADSWQDSEWGYGTSNYFAPDNDLGKPKGHSWATANCALADLVRACHKHRIRFFLDVVMGFTQRGPYQNINDPLLHVPQAQDYATADDDQRSSRPGELRQDWGGRLWRYAGVIQRIYDPISGEVTDVVPARQYMKAFIERWIHDFHIDGVRVDSIETVANWDFVAEFTAHARAAWRERWTRSDRPSAPSGKPRAAARAIAPSSAADARFLTVGEELSQPMDLLNPARKRLDGLWNEKFKHRLRSVLVGRQHVEDASFADTVRKLIDCRLLGFADVTEAVNYITSHDTEGYGNERLYDYLHNNWVAEKEPRIKLAFACLLTAVGIPMILAGEEFGDKSDLATIHPYKQLDTVNFERLQTALDQQAGRARPKPGESDQRWRARVFEHVARLCRLRASHPGLQGNETTFLHADFSEDKRVVVWIRGAPSTAEIVVVVANFSDYASPAVTGAAALYEIPGWPCETHGRQWHEVTQDRPVAAEWAGREPIYPWEAKVYILK